MNLLRVGSGMAAVRPEPLGFGSSDAGGKVSLTVSERERAAVLVSDVAGQVQAPLLREVTRVEEPAASTGQHETGLVMRVGCAPTLPGGDDERQILARLQGAEKEEVALRQVVLAAQGRQLTDCEARHAGVDHAQLLRRDVVEALQIGGGGLAVGQHEGRAPGAVARRQLQVAARQGRMRGGEVAKAEVVHSDQRRAAQQQRQRMRRHETHVRAQRMQRRGQAQMRPQTRQGDNVLLHARSAEQAVRRRVAEEEVELMAGADPQQRADELAAVMFGAGGARDGGAAGVNGDAHGQSQPGVTGRAMPCPGARKSLYWAIGDVAKW